MKKILGAVVALGLVTGASSALAQSATAKANIEFVMQRIKDKSI